MRNKKINISILLFLSLINFLIAQDIQFSDLSNLSIGRSAITSTNDGENIYIANGFTTNELFSSDIVKYDISSDSWSVLTSATIIKRYASCAILNNNLYVFNGFTPEGTYNDKMEVINLTTGVVTLVADNPNPAKSGGVSVWNNEIYSFGGRVGSSTYTNRMFKYNAVNNTWFELMQMPVSLETKGEIVNGKLYVFGGFNGLISDRIDIYDIATNTWETSSNMPNEISANATAVIDNKIYLVGDFINLTFLAVYDTTNNSFSIKTNNLNNRRHCVAEGINGRLYAIGGNTESNIDTAITSVQVSDLTLGNEDIIFNNEFKIYPNPTTNYLNFNIMFDAINIIDINGRTILSEKGKINKINVENIKEGVYILKGKYENKWFSVKWVK